MRGALPQHRCRIRGGGIIPADAGSTLHRLQCSSQAQDHPRGCGEHDIVWRAYGVKPGSSPRMRGALVPFVHQLMQRWIIPADAGSTAYGTATTNLSKDHPRGCGEHGWLIILLTFRQGSSPRMRGAPARGSMLHMVQGIIPADAGSTSARPMHGRAGRDHPRGCGEHAVDAVKAIAGGGSSPRMWGAHHLCRRHARM